MYSFLLCCLFYLSLNPAHSLLLLQDWSKSEHIITTSYAPMSYTQRDNVRYCIYKHKVASLALKSPLTAEQHKEHDSKGYTWVQEVDRLCETGEVCNGLQWRQGNIKQAHKNLHTGTHTHTHTHTYNTQLLLVQSLHRSNLPAPAYPWLASQGLALLWFHHISQKWSHHRIRWECPRFHTPSYGQTGALEPLLHWDS